MKLSKKILSIFLSSTMLFNMATPAFATVLPSNVKDGEAVTQNTCEHHKQHTTECGYSAAVIAAPCTHAHTAQCYTELKNCIHLHVAECYPGSILPTEGTPAKPTECKHICSEESGCITKELNCPHENGEHDAACGYTEAKEGTPCTFDSATCELCHPKKETNPLSSEVGLQCTCTVRCLPADGERVEAVNADCPICSKEDGYLNLCRGNENPAEASLANTATTAKESALATESNDNSDLFTTKNNAIMDLAKTKPAGFDATSTENPYGYEKDRPFMLSVQNELMLYQTSGNSKKDWTTYYKNFNVGDIKKKNSYNTSTGQMNMAIQSSDDKGGFSSTGAYSATKAYSYVESVAFDPTVSGRKDHVANVGYDKTNGNIYLWVLNTKTGLQSDVHKLGSANWLKGGIPQYQAQNFFAITAGDYLNKNLGDTIVVYVPADGADYALKEIRFSYDANGDAQWIENSSNRNYLHPKYSALSLSDSSDARDKLSVSLATGDFNGDAIDDLTVLSYVNRPTTPHTKQNYQLYTPVIRSAFGNADTDILQQSAFVEQYVSSPIKDKQEILSMYAPSISAGDVNGDGVDEIVAAGYKNTVQYDATNNATNCFNNVGDKLEIACYSLSSKGNGVSTERFFQESAANAFTTGGLWPSGDNIWQPLAISCVSTNGGAAAETVFIGGSFYDLSTSSPALLYTPEYFTSADKGAGSAIINVSFIQSVAAGNFDGNALGREQVAFVVGLKTASHEWYTYRLGIMGGCEYDDKHIAGKPDEFGVAKAYYSNDIDQNEYVIYNTAADKLNCGLVAIDKDDDGLMVKYDKKFYAYSDPTVLTVLQAAPYFNELGDYGDFDTGTTSYGLAKSYTYGITSSHSASIGVGLASDVAIPFFKSSLERGYTAGFTKSFDDSLTTSYGTSFTAGSFDTVVLDRTPVFIYSYTVWDTKKNEWAENKMQISIPKQPTYFTMSTEEYNNFVTTYNDYADANKGAEGEKIAKLNPINDQYLDHEGDPFNYRKDWTAKDHQQISKNPYSLGHNGGSIESNWSKEDASTTGLQGSNTFHFGMTIQTGASIGVAEAWGGYSLALDYSYNLGTYKTNSQTTQCAGTISNIDSKNLAAKQGIPKSVSDLYQFNWAFGMSEYKLGGGSGKEPVPCFGYAISDLRAPVPAIRDLSAKLMTPDSAKLEWTSKQLPGRLPALGYQVYLVEKDGYKKINDKPLDANTTSFEVSGLKNNTAYTYVVTPVGENGEGLWSNPVSVNTTKNNYSVTLPTNTPGVTKISATRQGNIPITSGDKIPENSIIYVDVQADNGYVATGYTLSIPGKPDELIPATPDSSKFSFVLRGNTTISVQTKQIDSDITFGVNQDSEGNKLGTIVATVFDIPLSEPGGTVNGAVTFTALANNGYVLREWNVASPTNTKRYDAAGNMTFTLNPIESSYEVTAIFIPEVEAIQKITITDTTHGAITVFDDAGNTLSPDETGQISVIYGNTVTFTATPDQYYRFQSWGHDFTGYPEGSITQVITKDMTISAGFYAPVKYGVTFGPNITATANNVPIKFGEKVAPGSKLVFTALSDNAIIRAWSLNGVVQPSEFGQTFELEVFDRAVQVDVTLEQIDNTVPTGEIKIGENSFTSFLDTITFNLVFKENVDILITGSDPETNISKIQYQMVKNKEDYNPDGNWTTYSGLKVAPNAQFIIYAKITNGQGMETIINSNGVILQSDTNNGSTPTDSSNKGGTNNASTTTQKTSSSAQSKNKSPITGDSVSTLPLCLFGLASLSIICILGKKRKCKTVKK